MKPGKIPENILKRSVTNLIGRGPVAAKDSAYIQNAYAYTLTASAVGDFANALSVECAVYKAANNIWAAGGKLLGIQAVFFLDKHLEEKDLKRLTRTVLKACDRCDTELIGGHTQGIVGIDSSVVAITAIGGASELMDIHNIATGDDIVISKWAGLEETALIVSDTAQLGKLSERFTDKYLEPTYDFANWLTVREEADIALLNNVKYMHDLSDDGINGALWDISEGSLHGIDVELSSIPFKQETVEIANYFDLNAYKMKSAGSLMMITSDGEKLVSALEEAGIPACVVGTISDNRDKIVRNEEEVRYLGRK